VGQQRKPFRVMISDDYFLKNLFFIIFLGFFFWGESPLKFTPENIATRMNTILGENDWPDQTSKSTAFHCQCTA
jgi:hypothetical protein